MKTLCILLAVVVAASASWNDYGSPGYSSHGGPSYGSHGRGGYGYGATVVKKVVIAEPVDAPAPYEMGYDIVDEYGNANGRRESGDAAGNKAGSYTINLADGRKRIVEYKADKHGFRAIVRTNEPGTDASQDPADVDAQSLGGYAAKPAAPVVVAKAPSYGYVQKAVVAPAPSYAYETGLGGGYGHGLGHGLGHGGGYGYDVSYGAEYGAYGRGQGAYGLRKGAYGYGGTGGGYSRSYNRRAAIPVYKGSRYHSY